jgi:cytochrome P450
VLIASANRDERHWEDPDRFDLRRATVRHLAFSRGPHVCPGAYVARQQVAHAALPALLALPGIRLASSDVRYQGWVFRGPARLDVSWR